MHGGGGGGGKKARIEIIPLIDIIFFLLATFIMVSLSMTKNQGVPVALPTASASQSLGDQQEMDKSVTLTVTQKGEVYFNKDKITIAQLPLKLQAFKTSVKDPRVIVNAESETPYKHVMAVVNEAKKLGLKQVGLGAEQK